MTDLTTVVDAMARGFYDNVASPTGDLAPGAFDGLDPVQQQGVRQSMLDLLMPALPSLEASEAAAERRGAVKALTTLEREAMTCQPGTYATTALAARDLRVAIENGSTDL